MKHVTFLKEIMNQICRFINVSKLIFFIEHSKRVNFNFFRLNDRWNQLSKWIIFVLKIIVIIPIFLLNFFFFSLIPNLFHDILLKFIISLFSDLSPCFHQLIEFCRSHFISVPNLTIFELIKSFISNHIA